MDKHITTLAILLTVGLTSLLIAADNTEALDWFKMGVRDSDPQKKIAAYEQAIQLEPDFTEALYNLGLAYKSISEFSNAELCFHKAYWASQQGTARELRLQIMYELATMLSHNSKNSLSEKILREALVLVDDDYIAGIFATELGKILLKQEKYSSALAVLKEAKSRYGITNADFINQLNQVVRQAYQDSLIQVAGQLAMEQQNEKAIALYKQLQQQEPESPRFRDAIADLEHKIQTARYDSLYARANTLITNKEYQAAINILEHILLGNPNHQQAQARLSFARERLQSMTTKTPAVPPVENKLRSMRPTGQQPAEFASRNTKPVPIKSNPIAAIQPPQRHNPDSLLKVYYSEGIDALDTRQFKLALAAFENVLKIQPHKRNIQNLVSTIHYKIEQDDPQFARSQSSAVIATLIDSLYETGLKLLVKDDWEAAVAVFEKLNLLRINDEYTENLLAISRSQLQQLKEQNARRTKRKQYASAVVMALLIGLLGIVIARWIILRRNRNEALDALIHNRRTEHIHE